MSDVQIPQQLIELHNSGKPREVAAGYLTHFRGDLEKALNYDQITAPRGGAMTLASFEASVALEVSTNERLAEAMFANPASFMKSIMLAAQCKLLVGGAYNLFYLIPRQNRKERRLEVTPLIGYKGLTDLAYRHPRVHKVDAVLVFEGEEWDYDSGAGKLTHKVRLDVERDEEHIVGGYARVVITEPAGTHPVLDDPVVHVMSRKQLMQVKERSDAWQQAERSAKEKGWTPRSPWHTDPLPMHRKTLLRAVMNGGSVPKDMGVGAVIAADDAASLPVELERTATAVPKVTRSESLERALGILPEAGEPFEWPEDAVQAMDGCQSMDEMNALKPRFQHFEGGDADVIRHGWERNEDRLSES